MSAGGATEGTPPRLQVPAADLLIRRAEPDDFAAVARVFASRAAAAGTLQHPWPSVHDWQQRLAANAPTRDFLLLALVAGEVVGHGALHGTDNPRRRHAWHLGLAVADPWQGRGVGTALLASLLDAADNWLGALRLELTVFTGNQAAIALYRRAGFVVEGTLRGYALQEGRWADAFTMARLHPRPPAPPGA